jgi:hypothetical protein
VKKSGGYTYCIAYTLYDDHIDTCVLCICIKNLSQQLLSTVLLDEILSHHIIMPRLFVVYLGYAVGMLTFETRSVS